MIRLRLLRVLYYIILTPALLFALMFGWKSLFYAVCGPLDDIDAKIARYEFWKTLNKKKSKCDNS